MNENLQDSLAEIINRSASTIESGVGFLKAELPDVVEQLLMWEMVKSGLFFILGITLLVLACKLVISLKPKYDDKGYLIENWAWKELGGPWPSATTIPVVGLLPGAFLIGALTTIEGWGFFKILIAPKIYLIEYAENLIK